MRKNNFQKKIQKIQNRSWHDRSQVTVFVILGIIILLLVGIFFYARYSTIKIKPPASSQEVSQDVKPLYTFVTDCLRTVSKDALIKLGNNGGYINFTGKKISELPYESDVLMLNPQKMPYWYYLKPCKDSSVGCLTTQRPPLCQDNTQCIIESNGRDSIQEQLNTYIEENMPSCLNNFDNFKDIFNINPGSITVKSTVYADYVEFAMHYPMQVNVLGKNQVENITDFVAEQNVKLKEIYEFAQEIYNAERDSNFLEYTTLNLISVYSGLSQDKLPPLSELEFNTLNNKIWLRSNVKNTLENDVLPYVDFIQIQGSKNYQQIAEGIDSNYSLYANGLYNSFSYKISNNTHFDLDANILYPYTDIYLNIGDSELIKPDRMNTEDNLVMKIVGFFLTEYKFKYDLSYPVIIKLTDDQAFNGEGFTFNYAMQTNLRQNVPVKGNMTEINFGTLKAVELDSDLQKPKKTITIDTYDKHTGQPLDNVYISYKCGTQYDIGQTALDAANQNPIVNGVPNAKAELKTSLPYCEFGGSIIYEKPGYLGGAVDYDNKDDNQDKNFRFDLWPAVTKNVLVYKRTPSNADNIRRAGTGAIALFSTQYSVLSDNESVLLSLERIKNSSFETDFPTIGFIDYHNSQAAVFTVSDQKSQIEALYSQGKIDKATHDSLLDSLIGLNSTQQIAPNAVNSVNYTIDVVPGTYTLDSYMMYKGTVHIPFERRTFCPLPEILGVCPVSRKVIDLPEQNFDRWLNGGAKLNFTLTENDVYGSSGTIVFYVLEEPLPTSWTMMEGYLAPEAYQVGKTFLVRPRLQ